MPETICKSTVTAGKDHSCIWCGEPITRGSRSLRYAYAMDGRICVDRYHTECWGHDVFDHDDWFEPGAYYRGTPIMSNDPHALADYLFGGWGNA
jgi:hypothetical protein